MPFSLYNSIHCNYVSLHLFTQFDRDTTRAWTLHGGWPEGYEIYQQGVDGVQRAPLIAGHNVVRFAFAPLTGIFALVVDCLPALYNSSWPSLSYSSPILSILCIPHTPPSMRGAVTGTWPQLSKRFEMP